MLSYLSCGVYKESTPSRPFRKYRRMVNSLYPSTFNRTVDPSSMKKFAFYCQERPEKLDKIFIEFHEKIILDLAKPGKQYQDRVKITLSAIEVILKDVKKENVSVFVDNFLNIIEILTLKSDNFEYNKKGIELFVLFTKLETTHNDLDASKSSQKYVEFGKKFAHFAHTSSKDERRILGLKGIAGIIVKIDRHRKEGFNIKNYDSMVLSLLWNLTHNDDNDTQNEISEITKNSLARLCRACNLRNLTLLIAQTIYYLTTHGDQNQSDQSTSNENAQNSSKDNYWINSRNSYFEMKKAQEHLSVELEQKNSDQKFKFTAYEILDFIQGNVRGNLAVTILTTLTSHVIQIFKISNQQNLQHKRARSSGLEGIRENSKNIKSSPSLSLKSSTVQNNNNVTKSDLNLNQAKLDMAIGVFISLRYLLREALKVFKVSLQCI